MSYRAPHQRPLEALGGPGAPACACCARRAGVGGARGARLLPAHARIPRGARDPRVRASLHPLRAPRGAPRGLRTPKPLRHNHERGVHAVETKAVLTHLLRVKMVSFSLLKLKMSAHTLRCRRNSSSSAIHVGGITPGAVPAMTAARGRHCSCAQSEAAGEKARTVRQRQQYQGDRIRLSSLHDRDQGCG